MTKTNQNVVTKRMGNFDMASAADRILAFWEKNPKGKISTDQSRDQDGLIIFKTYIWKNKKDYLEIAKVPGIEKDVILSSADSEGTAKQENSKYAKKDFEKLETISVGRALALLGFGKDGQVASTEEMERFHAYEENQFEEEVLAAETYLKESSSMDELKNRWREIDRDVQVVEAVISAKDDRKKELESKGSK